MTGVGRRGGEFIPGELERVANIADVVEGGVVEIVEQGADRRSWLASAPASTMPMPYVTHFADTATLRRLLAS